MCGSCYNAYRIRASEKNRIRVREANRRRKKTLAGKRGQWKYWIKKHYGLSWEEWHRMLARQDGLCNICLEPLIPACVDHNHSTLKVRGLLCRACNAHIAWLENYQEAILRHA